MQHEDRLRIWIEQGNVNISQLFFINYKRLGIEDVDAMLIMHMSAFNSSGNAFPTPAEFSSRMNLNVNEVSEVLQRLMQHGFLKIVQSEDTSGILHEKFSLQPLWNRITDIITVAEIKEEEDGKKISEGELFKLFEQEFGRFLSPMECESISMWLDDDEHSVEVIRAALKEAVIAQKLSLRYIDRILFEWKKKNVKTLKDVERQTKSFRTIGGRAVQKQTKSNAVKRVPFYNWLEERE
ncbi:DnaD domain-containing protein [Filibacter tadaridae]|uniref:DNA replication protein DnaD n=1 Tax=Filibacter tadaridae TaxID=2483811 RepID=A0A3P5X192_9BACL|nr:DnaD domain-containing protein [Filibacter tadaridae]VDC29136.1 DNA replication protein DnaD [Filibacter tadaridae]